MPVHAEVLEGQRATALAVVSPRGVAVVAEGTWAEGALFTWGDLPHQPLFFYKWAAWPSYVDDSGIRGGLKPLSVPAREAGAGGGGAGGGAGGGSGETAQSLSGEEASEGGSAAGSWLSASLPACSAAWTPFGQPFGPPSGTPCEQMRSEQHK